MLALVLVFLQVEEASSWGLCCWPSYSCGPCSEGVPFWLGVAAVSGRVLGVSSWLGRVLLGDTAVAVGVSGLEWRDVSRGGDGREREGALGGGCANS